jgi:hypothetical protein
VGFLRGMDDSDRVHGVPITRVAGAQQEQRRVTRSGRLATGTLACNRCDAPVAITIGPVSPTDGLTCPFCSNRATVRDFLSLSPPTRPARVEVRVVLTAWHPVRH